MQYAPCLDFYGNCAEAFAFCAQLFGGTMVYQGAFGEMPARPGKDRNHLHRERPMPPHAIALDEAIGPVCATPAQAPWRLAQNLQPDSKESS